MPNTLKTTAAGTVKVTAKVVNGAGPSQDYLQDFDITVIIPVTGITGVPASGTVGVDLTLAATVNPTNATYRNIIWSVKNAGTTGATISGNVLKTTAIGSATVTATIVDGAGIGEDYEQDFVVTIVAYEPPVEPVLVRLPNLCAEKPFTYIRVSYTRN